MHYDPTTAEVREFEHLTKTAHPDRVAALEAQAAVAQRAARPLDEFITGLAATEAAGRAS